MENLVYLCSRLYVIKFINYGKLRYEQDFQCNITAVGCR